MMMTTMVKKLIIISSTIIIINAIIMPLEIIFPIRVYGKDNECSLIQDDEALTDMLSSISCTAIKPWQGFNSLIQVITRPYSSWLLLFIFSQAQNYKRGWKRGNNYKWRVTWLWIEHMLGSAEASVNYIILQWSGTQAERTHFKPWCVLSLLYLDCHFWRETLCNWGSAPICMTGILASVWGDVWPVMTE